MVSRHEVVAERSLQWHSADRVPTLAPNQIHLWVVNSASMQMMLEKPHYRNMLSDRERQRAERIVDPVKRRLYMAGRVGSRVLLGQYTGAGSAELEFGFGARGKPELHDCAGQDGLKFNYTISAGHALYGFARNRELGVDMEIFPRTVAVERFARRILTDRESRSWHDIPQEQANNAMLCCWTRKEAYGKLLGVGIRYAMNRVSLFADLHRDCWHTGVSGLFEGESPDTPEMACGMQIGLPVAGAATLMYAGDRQTREPEFRALIPSALFWNG